MVDKDEFEKYSDNARKKDAEFAKFYDNIIKKGYLFNSIDVNLYNPEIQSILASPETKVLDDLVVLTPIPDSQNFKNQTALFSYFTKNMSLYYFDYIFESKSLFSRVLCFLLGN